MFLTEKKLLNFPTVSDGTAGMQQVWQFDTKIFQNLSLNENLNVNLCKSMVMQMNVYFKCQVSH